MPEKSLPGEMPKAVSDTDHKQRLAAQIGIKVGELLELHVELERARQAARNSEDSPPPTIRATRTKIWGEEGRLGAAMEELAKELLNSEASDSSKPSAE
jgi:hypothetical protein